MVLPIAVGPGAQQGAAVAAHDDGFLVGRNGSASLVAWSGSW